MDSTHYYEIIKKLISGTVLELAVEIEKLYDLMPFDVKKAFVIYLEFDFLPNFQNEIKSDEEKNLGLYRFMADYAIKVEELNKSKQKYEFLICWVKQNKNVGTTIEPEPIDLSNTKAIDKILYLHKLGIIDFLRRQQPFSTSVNSLATILSTITGEKSNTLQPMLNPMLSKKVDDSNNPLNSTKAVERVESQLINIGFNLNKTI
jgi:hypothetical protein